MQCSTIRSFSRRHLGFGLAACLALGLIGGASAQTNQLPPDLAGLPNEIKTLSWKSVDMGSVKTLEECRALLLLNHALDELSANSTAEADLMSAYIEKQNLGQQFASTPPPPDPAQFSFNEVEKIAVALLRGPMSDSYYSTELADVDDNGLRSYQQMYKRTCQRRLSEFEEAQHQLRCMASFLGNSQKLQDYDAWATAESALREQQHQQRAQANQTPQQNSAQQAEVQQLQQQNRKLQQALGAAEYQQQVQSQQTAQAQQAAAQAQQQAGQAQQQQQAAQPYQPGYVAPGAYGVYGAYGAYGTTAGAAAAGAYYGANAANASKEASPAGAAAAGAHAANQNQPPTGAAAAAGAHAANQNQPPAGAGAAAGAHAANTPGSSGASSYHAANSSWNKDSSYHSSGRSQTEQRMSGFHGTSSSHGGGRR